MPWENENFDENLDTDHSCTNTISLQYRIAMQYKLRTLRIWKLVVGLGTGFCEGVIQVTFHLSFVLLIIPTGTYGLSVNTEF